MPDAVPSIVFYYFDGQRGDGFPKSFQSGGLAETSGRCEHYREREALLQLPYGFKQSWKVPGSFTGTTTGQQDEHAPIRRKRIPLEKLGSGGADLCQSRQRMSYICCVNAARAKPLFFEGKQAKQLVHKFPDHFDPSLPPRPDLRG